MAATRGHVSEFCLFELRGVLRAVGVLREVLHSHMVGHRVFVVPESRYTQNTRRVGRGYVGTTGACHPRINSSAVFRSAYAK